MKRENKDDIGIPVSEVAPGVAESGGNAPVRCRRPVWLRMLAWTGGIIGGLILLVIVVLCGLTWWFNPQRLAEFIGKEVSENVAADVSLSEVNYTLWSSFPHLSVDIDSISVRSRTLDNVPDSLRAQVPQNADFLLSAKKFRGSINLLRLFSGRIYLKDIVAENLDVNLVALTDSLNNYGIVAQGGNSRIPYFNIDGLHINGDGRIAYTSVPASTKALVNLKGASLTPGHHQHHKDTYNLKLDGNVDVQSGNLQILRDFPFALAGDVGVRFDPFGVSTTDYRVTLGNIKGEMSMDMNIGDNPRMNTFAYRMSNFTMQDLQDFLPPGNYPALEHLDADLALDASARLTSPYDFASVWLPSIEVDFRVPAGHVSYTLSDGQRYEMNRVALDGRLVFDGHDPDASYVEIPDLNLSGDGIALNLNGRITDLTTSPNITARLNAVGNLKEISAVVPQLRPYGLAGDVDVDADVRFSLDGSTLYGALADLAVHSDNVAMNYGGGKLNVSDLHVTTAENYADALTAGAVKNRIPLNVKATAGKVDFTDASQGVSLSATGVKADGELSRQSQGKVLRTVSLSTSSDAVAVKAAGFQGSLRGLHVDFTGNRLASPVYAPKFTMPTSWQADSMTLRRVHHTPELIKVSLPETLKQLMALWHARVKVRAAGGMAGTTIHPGSTKIGAIDFTATADSVDLRRLTIGSGMTRGTVSARVGNLRQFLTSPVPAPLRVSVEADIDTIQINQLAREYTRHNPASAIARGDSEAMAGPDDTIALLIPRNVYADITATAKQTRYINLHLYDLLAKVRLGDGLAEIDTVRLGSDFGIASLNMKFDTRHMQDLNLSTHLDITDINIVNFFANFHKLLVMMPEAANFSGNVSAGIDARLRMFPSMYLNVPSIWADAYVNAENLAIKQSPFISHVTRMLLLPDHDTLHIRNISVHAGVHSNLLEVFPFAFEMSKYKLVLGGVNNFNGDLYYHIGVVDWPLKIPFGVNIRGDFHHPKLHFGGKGWHDRNGALITLGVDDNNRINVLKMGRRYMGEFVHTAATYQGD